MREVILCLGLRVRVPPREPSTEGKIGKPRAWTSERDRVRAGGEEALETGLLLIEVMKEDRRRVQENRLLKA